MWQISEKQKTLLRDDWTILRTSLESVGVVTFLNLFETHPETLRPFIQDVYSMKELELNVGRDAVHQALATLDLTTKAQLTRAMTPATPDTPGARSSIPS